MIIWTLHGAVLTNLIHLFHVIQCILIDKPLSVFDSCKILTTLADRLTLMDTYYYTFIFCFALMWMFLFCNVLIVLSEVYINTLLSFCTCFTKYNWFNIIILIRTYLTQSERTMTTKHVVILSRKQKLM